MKPEKIGMVTSRIRSLLIRSPASPRTIVPWRNGPGHCHLPAQRFTPRRRHAVPRPGCEGPQRPGYGGSMAVQVSEREARQVAEAARETEWKLPSFGRELFLGNFRLDLIHPPPRQ